MALSRKDFEELVARDREVDIRTRATRKIIWTAFWAIFLLLATLKVACIWDKAMHS